MIKISVAATIGSHSDQVLARLRDCGAEMIEVPVTSIPQTDDLLLLQWARPEEVARQAIVDNGSVPDALDEWATQARAMLDAFRRNRATAVVLDGAAACRAMDSVAQLLSERAGIEISDRTPGILPEIDPLQHVLAAQWVAESAELRHLCGALEAASTPLADASPQPAPRAEAAYRRYKEEQAKTTEALAAAERMGAQHATEILTLREQLAAAEKAPKPADDAELSELKEENELLLLQLHQVQEELESYYLQLQEVQGTGGVAVAREEELYALVRYAGDLEKRYLKVLKSRTWKVMAPVREAGRVVKSVVRGKRVPRNALPKRPAEASRYFPPDGASHGR